VKVTDDAKGTKIEFTAKSLPLAVVVKVQAPEEEETFPSESAPEKQTNLMPLNCSIKSIKSKNCT